MWEASLVPPKQSVLSKLASAAHNFKTALRTSVCRIPDGSINAVELPVS